MNELQERLNAIRTKHQKQRLELFENYKNLRTKARNMAVEAMQ